MSQAFNCYNLVLQVLNGNYRTSVKNKSVAVLGQNFRNTKIFFTL